MIVKGYKGIIDLDLTNIHPVYHDILKKQHKEDIENYKKYQESLEPELRYDNAIGKIIKDREYYEKLRDFYASEKKKQENQYYKDLLERYS
jgi:hypothetical protein